MNRLMPVENSSTNFLMKTLVEKYFTIENSGCELPELESTLLMKNGFVRRNFGRMLDRDDFV